MTPVHEPTAQQRTAALLSIMIEALDVAISSGSMTQGDVVEYAALFFAVGVRLSEHNLAVASQVGDGLVARATGATGEPDGSYERMLGEMALSICGAGADITGHVDRVN